MATNRHLNSKIRSIITMIQISVVFATLSTILLVGFRTIVNTLFAIILTVITLLGVVNVIWTAMEYTQKFVKGK